MISCLSLSLFVCRKSNASGRVSRWPSTCLLLTLACWWTSLRGKSSSIEGMNLSLSLVSFWSRMSTEYPIFLFHFGSPLLSRSSLAGETNHNHLSPDFFPSSHCSCFFPNDLVSLVTLSSPSSLYQCVEHYLSAVSVVNQSSIARLLHLILNMIGTLLSFSPMTNDLFLQSLEFSHFPVHSSPSIMSTRHCRIDLYPPDLSRWPIHLDDISSSLSPSAFCRPILDQPRFAHHHLSDHQQENAHPQVDEPKSVYVRYLANNGRLKLRRKR